MKDSYWLKSGVFSLLQRLSVVLFGFVGFYILIRVFSKEQFGVWMLFISVTAFTEVVRIGLIKNAALKYIVSSKDGETPKVLTAVMLLNVIITILIGLALFFGAGFLAKTWEAPQLDLLLKLYIITSCVYVLFYHFEYIQQANFNFKGTFVSYFIKQGLFLLYILILFFAKVEITLVNLAIAQILSVVLATAVSFFFTKQYLQYKWRYERKWVSKIFNFGKYTFGTNLSTMIFANIDQWMLGYIISPVSVALYNPAIRITNLVEVPTNSLASIVFPKVSQRLSEDGAGAAKHLYEKSVGVILALLLPGLLFVVLFSDFVITFIAGENYSGTVPILQITILFSLFVPFARQFGTILDGMGLPKVNFYFILSQAMMNIIFNYLFITHYGVIGAAYGTLTTFILGFIFNQIYLNKVIRTHPLNVLKQMVWFYREAWLVSTNYIRKKI